MTLTYEDRIIAFVDVLGFGALVEQSGNDPSLVQSISDALASVAPEMLRQDMFATPHIGKVPKNEREQFLADLQKMNEAMASQYEVRISYFSDSLVISADATNVVAAQIVVDVVGKLQMTFWMKHKLLLRGGITRGQLVHVQGGQLFGPAMNRAYHLESKVAKAPRVVIDPACLRHLEGASSWWVMAPFFDRDGVIGMSLAECYRQLLGYGAQYINDRPGWRKVRNSLETAPEDLKAVQGALTDESARSKYDWLIPKVELMRDQIGKMGFKERHVS